MAILHHDLETRSSVDLRKAGQYVYAESPSTEVILLSWAIDDGPIRCWHVLLGEPMPRELEEALLDPAVTLGAHNAGFERVLQTTAPMRPQRFLSLKIAKAMSDITRWDCTAARAAYMGLPRSLDKVGAALGLTIRKDVEGAKLMMRMCKPKAMDVAGRWVWKETEADIRRLGEYCDVDVGVEREVHNQVPALPAIEQEIWRANERMNDRGIRVDENLLLKMQFFVVDAEDDVNARLATLTNGVVTKASNAGKIKTWLSEQGHPEAEGGIGKSILLSMLENPDLTPLVREVVAMRLEGGKSSTAKYKAILARLNKDHRVRGAIVYCGAAATHRYSSRGAQLQNLTRGGTIKNIEGAIDAVLNGAGLPEIKEKFGAPMVVASELCRPTFTATEDAWLARGDYAQIELRVNAWTAGEARVLDAFRAYDTIVGYDEKGKPKRGGPDIYILAAADIAGVHPSEITKEDPRRQWGKVSELACGFGGGVGAFQAMARVYNVRVPDDQADAIKAKWRDSRQMIVGYWRKLENAAVACMKGEIGAKHVVRPGMWFIRGGRALVLRLPSGSSLFYWYPKLEKTETAWGMRWQVSYAGEDAVTKQFKRWYAYGGLFCENATQSIARDLMARALARMERERMNPVLTVHDEGIAQLLKRLYPTRDDAKQAMVEVMTSREDWHRGLPIAVDASADFRYLKD